MFRTICWTFLFTALTACGGSATTTDNEPEEPNVPTVGSETQLAEATPPPTKVPPEPAKSPVIGEEVAYEVDGTTLKGYLAYNPNNEEPVPGVIVVHEWWGHNEYVRERARLLAELGYTAFAIDMYGDGKNTEHPKEAAAFAEQALENMKSAQARFDAAAELLRDHKSTDADHLAAIGYCFGGGVALQMARMGAELDAVVSFHGSLGAKKKAQKGKVKPALLVLTGEDDPMVPAKAVEEFKKEMTRAKADFEVIAYPGVVHAFTNPDATKLGEEHDLPIKYDAQADQDSWERMKAFLASSFAEDADEEAEENSDE